MNDHTGVLTGKGLEYGGSLIRPEATGYGAVYFAGEMLGSRDLDLKKKTALVSGSGNVAQYTVEKLLDLGAKPITLSDSSGSIVDEGGIDRKKLHYVMELKNIRRGRIEEYAETYDVPYFPDLSVWDVVKKEDIKAELAFPSATQNEIDAEHAQALVDNSCICVSEGANMPSSQEAVDIFQKNKILYGPGKAANAGGVATSGLEMSQNSSRLSWTREEVDQKLHGIMKSIHKTALDAAEAYGDSGNYVMGANIAGFLKVAKAMLAYGVV
jgi:glutamate dehydrogenase (NADP+)